MSSHALLSAYLHAENKALLKSLKKKKSNTPSSNPKLQIESVPAGGTSLITIINEDCKRAFEVATSGWTDLQAPIITNELYESWIAIAKVQYAYLWFSMASFCGITGNTHGAKLNPGKERHVLYQILTKLRCRNNRVLQWWSMIETIALMAWSVGRTALDRLNYWGSHLSARTRDRLLSSLFGKEQNVSVINALFMKTIDNYQKGQQLKDQRSKHSSAFFEGTNQMAEKGYFYLET